MKEQFIPYKYALQLKHLGFKEECFSAYRNTDNEEQLMGISKWKNGEVYDNHEGFAAAPLWQQAFDWFEKEHSLYVMKSDAHRSSELTGRICRKVAHFINEIDWSYFTTVKYLKIGGYGNFPTTEELKHEAIKKLIETISKCNSKET